MRRRSPPRPNSLESQRSGLGLGRRANLANYVNKILRGAKPGDIPIAQPTKYDFEINLKTAKALSLTISPSLLLRANEVIQ